MKQIFIVILVVLAVEAHSQLKGSFQAGGNANYGNYSMISFHASADLVKEYSHHTWSFTPSYRWSRRSSYGSDKLNLYEDELYLDASWSKSIKNGWKMIAFTEDEKSFLRKMVLRASLGAGIGKQLIDTLGFNATLSEVILPEYYWSTMKSANNGVIRLSTRFKLIYENTRLIISSITLYQPAILSERDVTYSNNLNIRSTNSVTVKAGKKFSVGISHLLIYQGYPHYISISVKPLENDFAMNLKYSL